MCPTAARLIDDGYRARREDRSADARRHFSEAVALARQHSNKSSPNLLPDLVGALKGLAQIERDEGHPDAAGPLYQEAIQICRGLDDPLLLAHTVRHLGDVLQDVGHLAEAEACYDEALELYRAHPAPPTLDLANAVRPLAILKESTGELDVARRLWEEARSLYELAGVRAGVDESTTRLAIMKL
jgi:tetratricopeptide (TPR) repeat protein